MSNVADLLSAAANPVMPTPENPGTVKLAALQAGLPEQKIQQVTATADAKRVALGGTPDEQTIKNAAASRVTGAGVSSGNPIEHDLATLSWDQIGEKYGAATASNMLAKTTQFRGLQYGTRSGEDRTNDSIKGAALGLGDMVGGIGALGLSGIDAIGRQVGADTHMGVWAANRVKDMNDAVEGSQSALLQNLRGANQEKEALQARDNEQQFEQDKGSDGDLVASLKKIGRNAIDSGWNTISNPTLALDAASGAAGSLLAAGPITKGVGLAAKVLPKAMQAASVGPWGSVSDRLAASIGSKLPGAEAAGVGAMFGGGSYQGTAAQVANMDQGQLEQLPPYQALIAQGLSPDEARARLADQAGQMAAGIAAPAGMLAGSLAKNIIRNPFAAKSAEEGTHNIAAATAEQGLQGGAGQFANNVGIQQNVDPNQDLTAGVGEALGQGVVAGVGIGGAMQAPAMVGHGLKAVGQKGADAFNARLASIKADNDAKSPLANEKMAEAGAKAQEVGTSEPVNHALADMVQKAHAQDALNSATNDDVKEGNVPLPTSHGSAAEALANKITDLSHFSPSEITDSNLPDSVKEQVGGAAHRVDIMQKLADVVNDKGLGTNEGIAAAVHLYGEIGKFQSLVDDPARHEIPKDAPAAGIVDAYSKFANNAIKSPKIAEALTALMSMAPEDIAKLRKPQEVATLAAVAPERSNLRSVQIVLDDHNQGKIKLTAFQHEALLTAQAILSASKNANDSREKLGLKSPMNSVSDAVLSKDSGSSDRQRSAAFYAKDIFRRMKAGDTEGAETSLSSLGDFADHMNNKSDAVNRHYVKGGGPLETFDARNPDNGQIYGGKGQGVTPTSPKSVDYAQTVNIEAKQVSDVYNSMSKAFPQLNGQERVTNALHPSLIGDPKDVAQAHRNDKTLQSRAGDLASARAETKLSDRETQNQNKTTSEQLAKGETARPNGDLKPEATTGGTDKPQVGGSDEGAKAKEEKLSSEATPNIVRDNVAGAEGVFNPEHEKLSADLKQAGEAGSYADPEVRKDLQERLAKLSNPEFVKVLEGSYQGKLTFTDPSEASSSAIKKLMGDFTKLLGVKDANDFVRMIQAATYAVTKKAGGEFFKDGPVLSINTDKLALFESGENPIEVLRHVVAHELSHAVDFHSADELSMGSHETFKFDLDGALYKEFLGMKGKLDELASTPLYDYIEIQPNPLKQASEFFGELGAFVLSRPDLAEDLIPNGKKAFYDTVAKATGKLEGREPIDSRPADRGNAAETKPVEPDKPSTSPTSTESESERVAPSKALPKTVAEEYPNLVGSGKGKNWLHNAFDLVKEGTNRLVGLAEPYADLKRALGSQEALSAFLGPDSKRQAKLTPEIADAYKEHLSYLPKIAEAMEAQLAAKLAAGTNVEKLLAGEANRWKDGRALNLVEQKPDGSLSYNKPLLEKSIMAALQWVLVMDRQVNRDMDTKAASALTGIPIDQVAGVIDQINFGVSPDQAQHALAQKLMDFWGLKPKSNIGDGFVQGIPLGVAGDLLEALHGAVLDASQPKGEQSLLKITKFVVKGNTLEPFIEGLGKHKLKTIDRLESNMYRPKTDEERANSVFAAPTLIEEAVLRDSPDRNYHEGDTVPVAKTQMNNPIIENTPEQREMISKVQEVHHYLDQRTFDLYRALGLDNQQVLFGGGGDTSKRLMNAQDELSNKGKNLSISAAWDSVLDRVEELKTLPNKLETAMKFAYGVSSVGRLQMLGGYNSQGSKGIREVITPTWNTVDLRSNGKGNAQDQHFWNLALAQGLGLKIHQISTEAMNTKLNERLTVEFKKTIELLQDHLNGTAGLGDKLTETLKNDFEAAGVEPTYVALKALTEHAAWLNAGDNERANFKTSIYVEADGVTNGVNNAMHLFSSGAYTADQIENYKRGGRFYDGTKSMNDYRASADSKDLYKVGSDKLQKLTDELRVSLDGTRVQAQLDHMANVLKHLVDGIKYDPDTHQIETERGVIKNPMTITTYGAGTPGIAGNIADDLVRSFYSKLSKAMEATKKNPDLPAHEAFLGAGATEAEFKGLMESLNALLTKAPSPKMNELWDSHNGEPAKSGKRIYSKPVDMLSYSMDGLKKFVFTPEQFKSIQQNLLKMLVEPMKRGIDETLGRDMMANTQLVIQATQAQSIVHEHAFKDMVKALYADKKANTPGWKPTDGISQDELKHILTTLQKHFPLLEPDGQIIDPTGRNMTGVTNTPSAALSGLFETVPKLYGPSNSGVSGLPKLNIASGDGKTIQNAVVKYNLPKNVVLIFDGVNFRIKDIATGSEILNHSVLDAQQGNPVKVVLKSYDSFMKYLNGNLHEWSPEMIKEISAALDGESRKEGSSLLPEEIMDKLKDIHDELRSQSESIDLRHQVEQEFQSYTDNMAGAQSPHLHEGKVLTGSSQDIADAMNARLRELQKSKNSDRSSAIEIEFPPEEPREQPTVADLVRRVSHMQNPGYGEDTRLSDLNARFIEMFSRYLKPNGENTPQVTNAARIVNVQAAHTTALDLVHLAQANGNGFQMTEQATNTFKMVVSAFDLNMKLDPNALGAMNELYQHVLTHLTPSMLENPIDPDQVSRENAAQTKYDMIVGNLGTKTNKTGTSSLLPVFMGLALVDNGFRNALHEMDLPKTKFNDAGTVDAIAGNMGNRLLGTMADKLSGLGDSKTSREAIDALTKRIGDTALDANSSLEELALAPNAGINKANDCLVGLLERMSDSVIDKARNVKSTTQSKSVKRIAEITEALAGLVTEKNGALSSEAIMSASNRIDGKTPLREFIADLIGRTESNGAVYDQIKPANALVSKLRQTFRETVPKFLSEQFDRKLTPEETAQQHLAMGKSDLASLCEGRSDERVLELLADPRARASEKRTLEAQLRDQDPKFFSQVQAKADQLAEYMMKGTYGNNLLVNARSVADLNGERGGLGRKMDPNYVKAVDHLITLYALDKMDKPTQKTLTSLVQDQGKGTKYLLNYLVGTRKEETSKATGMALYNALKGHTPIMQQLGASLIVAPDRTSTKLLEKSYVRLADYHGSDAESASESRGYYYAPVSGRAKFDQGIIQNAAYTSGGVEISTGHSQGLTAGLINSPAEVARITKSLSREGATTENLKAIYNEQGKAVAYERMVDPSRLKSIQEDPNVFNALGAQRGRQVEESLTEEFNKGVIDKLKTMYGEARKKGTEKEFIDLNNPKTFGNDKPIQDAMRLMTPQTRGYLKDVFGDRFMVRRDMVLDVIGARKATVGDAWTGNTRWNQQTQDGVKNLAMSIFGNKAYQHMVNAESLFQGVVKEAKSLIVVKSVIVPLSNMLSNLYQLAARGVPVTDMIKKMPRFIDEAERYNNGRIKLVKHEADLLSAEGAKDFRGQVRIKAQIKAVEDGFKRLSIWPLINAGEMGAISHSDMPHEDATLVGGKLHDYMDSLVGKLPQKVQAAGRYALVTKDTALFKGLQKAVEYGDFLGKAMQYDHYINKKGFTSEQALARITEEYVNFDRLPGRARGYLDSMGLMWFMNFKIRTTKVALSMIRENPVQALLGSMVPHKLPGIGTVGTPFADNLPAKAFSGHLGYSLGPGMMFHAPMLNPWAHLMSRI